MTPLRPLGHLFDRGSAQSVESGRSLRSAANGRIATLADGLAVVKNGFEFSFSALQALDRGRGTMTNCAR